MPYIGKTARSGPFARLLSLAADIVPLMPLTYRSNKGALPSGWDFASIHQASAVWSTEIRFSLATHYTDTAAC